MKKIVLTLAASLALFLAACGGSPSTPEEVAVKYTKASFSLDYGAAKKLSSEKNKKNIEKEEESAKAKGIPPEKKEFIDKMKELTPKAEDPAKISEDGNSANVNVSLLDKDGKKSFVLKVKLVKEDDAWKVDGSSK